MHAPVAARPARRSLIRSRLAALAAVAALAACGGGAEPLSTQDAARGADGNAPPAGATTLVLRVGDERAFVVRDAFGLPHVFGPSNQALFEAYGYAVAQDRLFQLELNRRAARGTLAALFGPTQLAADTYQRTVGYTDAELDAMFAAMPPDEQAIYEAYRDGINRYLEEVVAASPLLLPLEFHLLGTTPAPWTLRDSMAFGAFMVRRFGEIGGTERSNLAVLEALVAARRDAGAGDEAAAEAAAIFDDVRWLDDPDAPVTVPTPASGRRHAKPAPLTFTAERRARPAAGAAPEAPAVPGLEDAKAAWEALGVPTRLGSYAWVVSAERSALGVPLLYGGPQMGASAPEVLHEVQLTGGEGFDVIGMAFAGVPAVLIGRNAHVAWTSTTATGDNVDVYLEEPCDTAAGPGTGTLFHGACLPLERRTEEIAVRGLPQPVSLTVLRSVHGPVVGTAGAYLAAERRAHWLRELEAGSAFFGFDRARNLEQFERAVRKVVTSHNFLYVDRAGNIAYWQAGQVPVRPAGADPRLPLLGDGSEEWTGATVPMPRSVNPPRGWLANWNNKPTAAYPPTDDAVYGKQGRLREIDALLAGDASVTMEDMRAVPRDIGRVRGGGRDARFLQPYLLAALDAVPPAAPEAALARAVLEGWDGSAVADAVTSTTVEPGVVIFEAWLGRALAAVFGDELGAQVGRASPNLLLHVLDHASGAGTGVVPSRDYLNGAAWQEVLSASFDAAVGALAAARGPDPAAWTEPRPLTLYRHPLFGTVGAVPQSNRATYAQIVAASRPRMTGESIFSLGQSGFFAPPAGAPDPHALDQLPLYRAFEYKPQVLLGRPQRQ